MLESALLTNLLLGGILFLLVRALRLLRRIASGLEAAGRTHEEPPLLPDAVEKTDATAEEAGGGMFERFLEINPEWREESKAEQAAAYRRWRKRQGLNWQSR